MSQVLCVLWRDQLRPCKPYRNKWYSLNSGLVERNMKTQSLTDEQRDRLRNLYYSDKLCYEGAVDDALMLMGWISWVELDEQSGMVQVIVKRELVKKFVFGTFF